MRPIYIYDPSAHNQGHIVRGVGRFTNTLYESVAPLAPSVHMISQTESAPSDAILIIPYVNPVHIEKIHHHAARLIGCILDVIPLEHKQYYPLGLKGNIKQMMSKNNARQFDVILTISQSSADKIHRWMGIPRNDILTLFAPVNRIFLDNTTYSARPFAEPYAVYVGDATWNKNISTIAHFAKKEQLNILFIGKIFEQIRTKNLSDFSHPWHAEIRAFYEELNDNPYVHLIGFVPDELLPTYYHYATCNILVSRDEGFGYSFAEAALCKTPSILSDIPVFHEVSQDHAYFANYDDVGDIHDTYQQLLTDPQRTTIVEKAYETALLYSPKRFGKLFMDGLQRLE